MFKKTFIRMIPLLLWGALSAQAAVIEYVRDYTYQGQRYDNESTCRVNAIEGVKRELLEELGTYVGVVVGIHQDSLGNSYMSKDVINITAGIVAMRVMEERWHRPMFFVKAGIKADPDDVLSKLKALRADIELEKALRDSYEELKEAREEVSRLRAQLEQQSTETTADHAVNQSAAPVMLIPGEAQGRKAESAAGSRTEAVSLVTRYENAVQDVAVSAAFQRALAARLNGDFDTLFREMNVLAAKGQDRAQFYLGWLYERGVGVQQDYAKAREWYEKAMQNGSGSATARMGMLYEHGLGVKKDYGLAVSYNQRAIDARSGLGYAQMGYLYETGKGVKQDRRKAAELYRIGMEKGNFLAMTRMGALYQSGLGVDQDEYKAVELYRKAADHGQPLAMARLGQMYNLGRGGLPQDHARALALIRESMRYKLPASIAFMGFMYENGWAVEKDLGKARESYEQAAELDVPFAEQRLGVMYKNGTGVWRDRSKAIYWLERAASKGDDKAAQILSRMR